MKKHFKPPAFLTLLEEDSDLEFQITPMIDLLLVLLIFFMAITTTKILRNDTSLQLPQLAMETSATQEKTTLGQAVINISWQKTWATPLITIDQTQIPSLEEMALLLVQKQSDFQKMHPQKQFRLFIRADRQLPYHFLQNILKICQQKGLYQITFATTTP